MKPLTRLASRAALSARATATSRPTFVPTSKCLRCTFPQPLYSQRRGFASDDKPDNKPHGYSPYDPTRPTSQSSIEQDLERVLEKQLAKEKARREEQARREEHERRVAEEQRLAEEREKARKLKEKEEAVAKAKLAETEQQQQPSEQKPEQHKKTPTEEALNGETIDELPSVEQGKQHNITKRINHLMDHLQSNIFIASQRLNDLTGYSGIEELKIKIQKLEKDVSEAHEAVRAARARYKATVAERASSQKEVTALLARKDSWSASDLERFTTLYRSDHTNEQAVQEASVKLADAERHAEDRAMKLSSTILARYHEEQIWSDKIRRMSTWGTWGLMGVNILLFLVFQLGFEPWRRKRLVKGFEDKVREALELERQAATNHAAVVAETASIADVESEPVEAESEVEILKAIDEVEEEAQVAKEQAPEQEQELATVTTVSDEEALQQAAAAASPIPSLGEGAPFPTPIELDVPAALMKLRTRQHVEDAVKEWWSENVVAIRKKDLTTVALQGAAAGATIATLIFSAILFSRS